MPTYVSSMPLCCLVPSSKFGTRSMRPGICVIEMAIGYPKTLTASSSMPLIVTIGSACDPTSWPLQLKGWEGLQTSQISEVATSSQQQRRCHRSRSKGSKCSFLCFFSVKIKTSQNRWTNVKDPMTFDQECQLLCNGKPTSRRRQKGDFGPETTRHYFAREVRNA